MSRTFFLSPDPKPNRAFEVTFIIEGLDDQGEPFAVAGDKYLMISLVEGSIIFERPLLEIKSVDKKANHRAVLKFTSRDGFNAIGAFPLAVEKSDDPTTREEITVIVVAERVFFETAPPRIPITLSAPALLPVIKTTDPTPKPSIPITGEVISIATGTPVASSTKSTPIIPPLTPTNSPKQSHPLRLAAVIGLAFVVILGAVQHFNKKPQTIATQPKVPSTASVTNNKPDTVSNMDTSNAPEVTTPPPEKQNIAPPVIQPAAPPQAPAAPTEPAPTPKCGACP